MRQLLNSKGMLCYSDHIQAAETACMGWFLGANPKCFNGKEIIPAIKAHPLVNGKAIEVRIQDYRKESRTLWHDNVKAPHILCTHKDAKLMKQIMNRIYGSERAGGLPLGKDLCFIPYTADYKIPITPKIQSSCKRAAYLQKDYITSTVTAETDKIAGLDYYIEHGINATLIEAIMCMKASDGDTSLFSSVDTHWNGNIIFTYHKSLDNEVSAIIPFLDLIMEAKFGPRAWGWFKASAHESTEGMYWDKSTGQIQSHDELALDEVLQDLGRS